MRLIHSEFDSLFLAVGRQLVQLMPFDTAILTCQNRLHAQDAQVPLVPLPPIDGPDSDRDPGVGNVDSAVVAMVQL
jgi:hypothetical protein